MDTRRELQFVRKQLDQYHRKVGENVLWAAYDPSKSVVDDIYNEPGTRVYTRPVEVQTLWINLTEGGKRYDDERFDVKNHLSFAVSSEALRNAGILDVFNDTIRIFDLIQYWDRAWSIVDWEILGRFRHEDSSTIAVLASQADLAGDYPFEPNTFSGLQVPSLSNSALIGFDDVNTLRHGHGPPSDLLGIDGDYYIDQDAPPITIYGPKGDVIGGVWPTPPQTITGGGGGGGSATVFTFVQTVASNTWTIVHNLGHYPAGLSVRLNDGTEIFPSRTDTDLNNTVLTFGQPYAGTAELV